MALTNTGGSRNQNMTVTTTVNGSQTSNIVYWITQDTTELSFRYLGNIVTATDLATLPEGDHQAPVSGTYADLLVQFRAAVEALYTDLDTEAEESNTAWKDSDATCPISTGGGPELPS